VSANVLERIATDGALPRTPYDYQLEAVRALDRLTPGQGGILALPTGGGKTKTAVWWMLERMARRGGRVRWLAGRAELLDQAAAEVRAHAGLLRSRPQGKAIPGTGIGDAWEGYIDAYNAATGATWPFDISRTYGTLVPGVEIDDLVPFSVIANIEVESYDPLNISDFETNQRLDGSVTGIYRYRASESHRTVDNADSESVRQVTLTIESAYWP